jgi:hypothetical protein
MARNYEMEIHRLNNIIKQQKGQIRALKRHNIRDEEYNPSKIVCVLIEEEENVFTEQCIRFD